MYKLILADGTEIKNLRLNGNNFISETEIDVSVFDDNLSTLTYTDGTETVTMHDAVLIQQVHYSDGWYICFRELTEMEKTQNVVDQNRADVDFLMVMGGYAG